MDPLYAEEVILRKMNSSLESYPGKGLSIMG